MTEYSAAATATDRYDCTRDGLDEKYFGVDRGDFMLRLIELIDHTRHQIATGTLGSQTTLLIAELSFTSDVIRNYIPPHRLRGVELIKGIGCSRIYEHVCPFPHPRIQSSLWVGVVN